MDVDAEVKFQHRVWTAQRVGWIIIGLVVAAALAGLFGTGPLSRASAQGPGVQIDYERFGRWQQPMKLRCFLSATKSDTQIALSRAYLESVQVEEIIPRPVQVEAAGHWLVYRFAGPAPMTITFNLRPREFGSLTGAVRSADGEAVSFRHFIYP
jgi:hypothetical protein